MSTPVLELVDLRKSFDQNLVLHDVNLVVPEHTATVLIGAWAYSSGWRRDK
jgi:polar amino acid transport system ATP-binding protein